MSVAKDLVATMRESWDRRIGHDYLGWMNDRVENDEEMWKTGARDLEALLGFFERTQLLDSFATARVLDVGCGVGRILGPASQRFSHVSGTDISPSAVARANELLADRSNVQVSLGDGQSLAEFSDESFDLVYSFGVLCNMPVDCAAAYFLEIHRVLKQEGFASVQVFIGKCQPTLRQDTVAFRSFLADDFTVAMERCGFEVQSSDDLQVDSDAPDDGWLRPKICVLQKQATPRVDVNELARVLYPRGEGDADTSWPGSQTEYLLSVKRALEYYDKGEKREAYEALQFALAHYKDPEPRLQQLLAELSQELGLAK